MRALLIDLDGVVYEGNRVVPGAPEVIRWLEAQSIPHLFVTNTTSRPRRSLIDKLAAFGINVGESAILTPPIAATLWLRDLQVGRIAALVPEATLAEFADFELAQVGDLTAVEAVVVGDLGRGWTFDKMNWGFRLLMDQPQPHLVALGMTRYWNAPDGLSLDTAPFVVALSHASGTEPVIMGKPAAPFFESALAKLNVSADETFMIGDDIVGDVNGAQAAGMAGLLVRTGKFRGTDIHNGVRAHAVLDSFADLPAWWRSEAAPT